MEKRQTKRPYSQPTVDVVRLKSCRQLLIGSDYSTSGEDPAAGGEV